MKEITIIDGDFYSDGVKVDVYPVSHPLCVIFDSGNIGNLSQDASHAIKASKDIIEPANAFVQGMIVRRVGGSLRSHIVAVQAYKIIS